MGVLYRHPHCALRTLRGKQKEQGQTRKQVLPAGSVPSNGFRYASAPARGSREPRPLAPPGARRSPRCRCLPSCRPSRGKGPLLFCHRIPLRPGQRRPCGSGSLLFFLDPAAASEPTPVCDREEGSVRYRKDPGDLAVPGGSGGVSQVRASDRRGRAPRFSRRRRPPTDWEGTLSCRWSGDTHVPLPERP